MILIYRILCLFLLHSLVVCQIQQQQVQQCTTVLKEDSSSSTPTTSTVTTITTTGKDDVLNISSTQPPTSQTGSFSTFTASPTVTTSSATELSSKFRSENCDKTFHEKKFFLQSYNYSNNYPDNIDCTYIIFKNSSKVCYIELTFLHFDLEVSPFCVYDYLSVNSIRFCGTLMRQTTRTYIFNTTEQIMKFHSDNTSNRSGFLIQFEQLECHGDAIIRNMNDDLAYSTPNLLQNIQPNSLPLQCDSSFSDTNFEIISPLYPSSYPRSSDCYYIINKFNSNVCHLEVTYIDFDLQGANEFNYCTNDYLDFNGIRMCGKVNQNSMRNYYFPDSKFTIRFHADSAIQGRGFRLAFKQGECNNKDESTSKYPIMSTINSASFSTTNLPGFSERTTSSSFSSSSSSSYPTKRFQSHHCDQVYSEGFFEIISPKYPANYPQSTTCTYTILKKTNVAPICQLEMHVLEFELDESADCRDDYMDLDGHLYCGSIASKTIKYFPFDRNDFVIKFKSDDIESPAGRRAFHLQFRQKECPDGFSVTPQKPATTAIFSTSVTTESTFSTESMVNKKRLENCALTIQDENFELKSPHYPLPYENNFDCPFTIKRLHENICYLHLIFVDFDVDYDKDCKYDYLAVDSQLYCGLLKSGHTQVFSFSNRSEIAINFHSDGANSGRGFYLKGIQKECSHMDKSQTISVSNYGSISNQNSNYLMSSHNNYKNNINNNNNLQAPSICEVCFASKEGIIKSYNYPNQYPSNLTCNYRIAGLPDYCAVYLKFEAFDLEDTRNGQCLGDYLLLDGQQYCGNQLSNNQKLVDLTGNPKEVLLKLVTNSKISGRGFRVQYAQIPCTNLAIINQGPISQQIDRLTPQIVIGSEPISVLESSDKKLTDSENSRIPCDVLVIETKFEITSPGFPYEYPPKSDCLYSIRRRNFNYCKLRLELEMFELEANSLNCDGDNLEIEGDKICGIQANNTIKEYDFKGYRIALRFRSDEYGSKKGFKIRGEQIECSKSQNFANNLASFSSHSAPYNSLSNEQVKTHTFSGRPSPYYLPDYQLSTSRNDYQISSGLSPSSSSNYYRPNQLMYQSSGYNSPYSSDSKTINNHYSQQRSNESN